jgi:hypothetical protein
MPSKDLRDLAEVIALLDKPWPDPGPLTADEDENGVVHIYCADGTPHMMMSRADYDEFRAYGAPNP